MWGVSVGYHPLTTDPIFGIILLKLLVGKEIDESYNSSVITKYGLSE